MVPVTSELTRAEILGGPKRLVRPVQFDEAGLEKNSNCGGLRKRPLPSPIATPGIHVYVEDLFTVTQILFSYFSPALTTSNAKVSHSL